MAKYTINMNCGHKDTIELFGKSEERRSKIEYFTKYGTCKKCYAEKLKDINKEKGLIINAAILPYINEKTGKLLVFLYFEGDTLSNIEKIKSLKGYRWTEKLIDDDTLKEKFCWNKIIDIDNIDEEIQEALLIGAKNIISKEKLIATLNYKIAKKKQNKWKKIDKEYN